MKILYLVEWFAGPNDPGFSRAYQHTQFWVEVGHDVTIIAGQEDHFSLRAIRQRRDGPVIPRNGGSLSVVRVRTSPLGMRGSLRRGCLAVSYALATLVTGLRRARPDIVVASSPPSTIGIVGVFLARWFGIPLVYEVRDLWPDRLLDSGMMKPGLLAGFVRGCEILSLKHATAVLTVCTGDRNRLLRRRTARAGVFVVPHGADDWMTRPLPEPAARSDDVFRCLYAGSLSRFHRVHELIDVATQLGPPERFAFLIIGDGDERAALARLVQDRGLRNVTFVPPISKRALFHHIVREIDACILISGTDAQYRRWLPNKVFDYLASGVSVVASAHGELARLVDRAGGVVVKPGDPRLLADALRTLASWPSARRKSMGVGARTFVLSNYARSDSARAVLDVMTRHSQCPDR